MTESSRKGAESFALGERPYLDGLGSGSQSIRVTISEAVCRLGGGWISSDVVDRGPQPSPAANVCVNSDAIAFHRWVSDILPNRPWNRWRCSWSGVLSPTCEVGVCLESLRLLCPGRWFSSADWLLPRIRQLPHLLRLHQPRPRQQLLRRAHRLPLLRKRPRAFCITFTVRVVRSDT